VPEQIVHPQGAAAGIFAIKRGLWLLDLEVPLAEIDV
jgi:hypothetical protein